MPFSQSLCSLQEDGDGDGDGDEGTQGPDMWRKTVDALFWASTIEEEVSENQADKFSWKERCNGDFNNHFKSIFFLIWIFGVHILENFHACSGNSITRRFMC